MSSLNITISHSKSWGKRHEPFEKKTIILGYWKDIPIIKAYPEEGSGFLIFWCEYAKGSTFMVVATDIGQRIAQMYILEKGDCYVEAKIRHTQTLDIS